MCPNLRGQGGSGKDVIQQLLLLCLGSHIGSLPSDALSSTGGVAKILIEIAEVIVSSRIASICIDNVGLCNHLMIVSMPENITKSNYKRVGIHYCKSMYSLLSGTTGSVDLCSQREVTANQDRRSILSRWSGIHALTSP